MMYKLNKDSTLRQKIIFEIAKTIPKNWVRSSETCKELLIESAMRIVDGQKEPCFAHEETRIEVRKLLDYYQKCRK